MLYQEVASDFLKIPNMFINTSNSCDKTLDIYGIWIPAGMLICNIISVSLLAKRFATYGDILVDKTNGSVSVFPTGKFCKEETTVLR